MRAPLVEAKARPAEKEWNARPLLLLVGLSVGLITVMNLTAAVYLYRASGQVRAAEQRLEELAAFDARMRAKLDLMNNGIQGQFDKLNAELRGNFSEVFSLIAAFEHALADAAESRQEDGWGPGLPTVSVVNPDRAEPPAEPGTESQPETSPDPDASPQASSAYRRIEAADGRVYYRKMQ